MSKRGGGIAGNARRELEEKIGVAVVTSDNAVQLNQVVTEMIEYVGKTEKLEDRIF